MVDAKRHERMILTRGALRAIIGAYFAVLAALYLLAWIRPAVGLLHEDALHLVTARALAAGHGYTIESLPRPIAQTQYPPLFPALLALFSLVSSHPEWLKLLPLITAAAWFWTTHRLLMMMGASEASSLMLVALTAASPSVIFLSTSLFPQSLFGLLAAGTLLALLKDRSWLAGLLAGLATLAQSSGIALIVACILTLAARRRLRAAVIVALLATVLCAPWFGWSLAESARDNRISPGAHPAFTIWGGLAAGDKFLVLGRNLFDLVAAPGSLMAGYANTVSLSITIVLLLGCLIVRRQTVPDLFLLLYAIALACFISPPQRAVAPVLPLVLWILWRALRRMKNREALAAILIIVMAFPVGLDIDRLFKTRPDGAFTGNAPVPDNWSSLDKVYTFLGANASPDAVVLANMDTLTYLKTGRKALRGFDANAFDINYSPRNSPVTPDQLSSSITRSHAEYVVLSPDSGLPESTSFHKSVEALERGGIIEPLELPGAAPGYRLFRVTANGR